MIIHFKANKGLRNLVPHQIPDVRFHKGKFRTADKQIISKLLASTEYERQYIGIDEEKNSIDLVNDYLEGKTPDKFTKELLSKVSPEGLTRLAKAYGVRGHQGYPTVIKTILEGKYISNQALDIIEEYATEEKLEDIYEQAQELGVIVRNGPWYKFAPNEQAISKSEADAKIWAEQHKTQLKKAIAEAKQKESELVKQE